MFAPYRTDVVGLYVKQCLCAAFASRGLTPSPAAFRLATPAVARQTWPDSRLVKRRSEVLAGAMADHK